jgi:hypothetical protein
VADSLRGLVTYTIPKVDVNMSSVIQDKPNIGTDQTRVAGATYTLGAPTSRRRPRNSVVR